MPRPRGQRKPGTTGSSFRLEAGHKNVAGKEHGSRQKPDLEVLCIQRAIRGDCRVLGGEEAGYNLRLWKTVGEVQELVKVVRPDRR